MGKIVSAIPPPSRVSKYNIDWDNYVEVAKFTKSPVLAGVNIRETQVKSMRLYTRHPFVQEEGHIKIALRNSKVKNGVRIGDVYMVWIPKELDVPTN
ncbi:hypothetical protein [Pseudarthrobacter sp. MDT1-22]